MNQLLIKTQAISKLYNVLLSQSPITKSILFHSVGTLKGRLDQFRAIPRKFFTAFEKTAKKNRKNIQNLISITSNFQINS